MSCLSIAPGRVNLLGEHVDYNEGAVLPVAIDRAVRLTAEPLLHHQVIVEAPAFNQEVVFDLCQLQEKRDAAGNPLPPWALYPAGVAWALQEHGLTVRGIRAKILSDIPIGAGLSSSAALEVSFAVLWQMLGGWSVDRMTLARICQEAESQYVGMKCGLMDQFVCLHGVQGCALYFDTRSLEWKAVALPADIAIVVADSGVRHELVGSAYNERRAVCEQAVRLLQQEMPEIHALRDVSPADLSKHRHLLTESIYRRARHVVEECVRVQQALECLIKGDAVAFGQLMFEGHASQRDFYEVSCRESDILVEIGASLPGCLGMRQTGGGFGGCSVALVREEHVYQFTSQLRDKYFQATGIHSEVYLCRASEGARVLADDQLSGQIS
ncbi:MAG: galactokinase [Anaerolineae bacterium]|nr:galactokinase [Anaerolineae bacterium]